MEFKCQEKPLQGFEQGSRGVPGSGECLKATLWLLLVEWTKMVQKWRERERSQKALALAQVSQGGDLNVGSWRRAVEKFIQGYFKGISNRIC